MSKFRCDVTYNKVEGNSLLSTQNKLRAHGFVDQYWNISTSMDVWRSARSELNELGSAKLGRTVNLFTEKKLLTGTRAIPDVKYFKMIDEVNSNKRDVNDDFIQNDYIRRMTEQIDSQGDSNTNLIQDEFRRFLKGNLGSTISQRPGNDGKTEEERRGNREIYTGETLPDTEILYGEYTSSESTNIGDTRLEQNPSSVRSSIYDKYSGINYRRFIGKTFTDIFSGEKYSALEREYYGLLRFNQSLQENQLNRGIAQNLGLQGIHTEILEGEKLYIYSDGDSIRINIPELYNNLQYFYDAGVNMDTLLNTVIFEELIHIIGMNVISEQDLKSAVNDFYWGGGALHISRIYKSSTDKYNLYHEGVRMLIQKEFLGHPTEELQMEYSNTIKFFFSEIWRYLEKFFTNNTISATLAQNIRDYINDKYGDIKLTKGQVQGSRDVYKYIDQKSNTPIKEDNLDRAKEAIEDFNSRNTTKKLSLVEVNGGYLVKTDFTSNYLYRQEPTILEEIKTERKNTDSNNRFDLKCITG